MKPKFTAALIALALWGPLFLFCGLTSVLIAEMWVRGFVPVQNVCYTHDPILGDTRCPNQTTYGYVETGYSNILRTNHLGFHDVDRLPEKSASKLRILYFGDSLTSGVGVPVDDTIPSVVERALNAAPNPAPAEVLNMAPAEDSTVAQLLVFQRIGKQYHPDVVVCHFMCDFSDNIFETHQRTRSPYFLLTKDDSLEFIPPVPVDLTTPAERLKRSSMLVRLLANKLLASTFYSDLSRLKDWMRSGWPLSASHAQGQGPPGSAHQRVYDLLSDKSWPLTMRILKEFKKEAEDVGAVFIMIDGCPFLPHTAGKYTNKDLERFCETEGIPYIPVYEEYQGLKDNDLSKAYLLGDGHPTAAGNQRLGETVANKLNIVLANTGAWMGLGAKRGGND